MAASDPIADGLTKLRNASRARQPSTEVPYSGLFLQMLEVLKEEGFIRSYREMGEQNSKRTLRVYLKYVNKTPVITNLVRMSKPGLRLYRKAKKLPRVLDGLGLAVVTTSKGVMTDRQAYRQRIGGEVVCYVW